MASRLDNMVIAVTGGGQGIGRAIALRLASEGAHVAIVDQHAESARRVVGEVQALGREGLSIEVDVSTRSENERAVEAIVDRLGRLDVMYANAGVALVKPIFEISEKDWEQVFSVNCRGAFFTLQAAARQMVRQDRFRPGAPKGKIVMMASISGRYGGRPMMIPYAASKAAVISMAQGAAIALAPEVTVNAMCPGVVETDMWKTIDEQWTRAVGWERGEAWRQRIAPIPMGRAQTPDDVAGLAYFLASPDSDYMTGQTINIDGGLILS